MFDAEKLLSKVVNEVVGSGKGKGKKKGKKKKKGSSGLVNSLSSGAGLMTIIGLGVGAYEILKTQKAQQSTTIPSPQPGTAVPPPPPPVPGAERTAVSTPVSDAGKEGAAAYAAEEPSPVDMGGLEAQEMACRMIQVMIAAAHADGTLDAEEEKAVLERLRSAGLDQEEVMFLLDELHKPKTIKELTAGITDPSVAKTMYMLALSTIDVDTEGERKWLDQLAGELKLSPALQQFMEEQ